MCVSTSKETFDYDEAKDNDALWMDQYSDNHQRSHQLGGGTFYFVKLPHKGLPIYDVFIERSKGDWLLKAVIVREVALIPYCIQVPKANKGCEGQRLHTTCERHLWPVP